MDLHLSNKGLKMSDLITQIDLFCHVCLKMDHIVGMDHNASGSQLDKAGYNVPVSPASLALKMLFEGSEMLFQCCVRSRDTVLTLIL